jgi:hypothetical protein
MPIHPAKAILAAALAAAFAAAACAPTPNRDPRPPRSRDGGQARAGTLRAFSSRQEFAAFLRGHAEAQRARAGSETESASTDMPVYSMELPAPTVVAKTAADEVTNVQHAGVDEGGIVKVHGNHLVILRRGRLFTVAIGGGALRPVAAVDAYPPGADASGDWYDEMLISGDQVVVIGYSYSRGGTEVGLFHVDAAGRLRYQSTYHLRSDDYYSSRNYASRLTGGKLVFYTPLHLDGDDPDEVLPAIRRWRGPESAGEAFHPIVAPTRIYRPERSLRAGEALALHTVTTCDLAGGEMACEATAVVGPMSRVFYVSPHAVYAWLTSWTGDEAARAESMVYRLPLDGSGPGALGVAGGPVDQFSFLESPDGHLNVLVRDDAGGEGMWGSEDSEGPASLLRVPLASFGDGSASAPASSYRRLATPPGSGFQNRFVGDWLLYGTAAGQALHAVRWAGGPADELALPHGVERIEAMGSDAVVVGAGGADLYFSGVRLGARTALAGRYTLPGASQGELRSHGFFYRADGEGSGMLGLPVRGAGEPGYARLVEGSASILFLRNQRLRFAELGQLRAGAVRNADDGCRASCMDWYGNARPLFLRGRIFALLGYELVEGTLSTGGGLREMRRVSYAPVNGRMPAED